MSVLAAYVLAAGIAQQGAASHTSCGVVGAPPGATVGEFSRLEAVWNQAYLQSDVGALDGLWSDNIKLLLPGMPLLGKTEALAAVSSRRTTFTRHLTSDLKVDPESAMVTGTLSRSRTVEGRTIDDVWLFKKVYVRGAFGCWQVALYQALDARE